MLIPMLAVWLLARFKGTVKSSSESTSAKSNSPPRGALHPLDDMRHGPANGLIREQAVRCNLTEIGIRREGLDGKLRWTCWIGRHGEVDAAFLKGHSTFLDWPIYGTT